MRNLAALSIAILALTACTTGTNQMTNETIFTGGTVAAGPQQTPQHDYAVAVRGGVVVEGGPADEVRAHHANARVIDASSATILPGLTDAHAHLYGLAPS